MHSPTSASTSSGAELPLVALPQVELLTVHDSSIPWLENSLGEGIRFKPLRLDIEAGVWVILVGLAAGSRVQIHYHTGVAEVYTLQGCWNYAEYPNQPQTAGSYLYEPSGSVHTLVVPESNTEETVLLSRVVGANINFNEDGSFHSILDATSLTFLADLFAEAIGITNLSYISGGDAAAAMAGTSGVGELPAALATALQQG